jgi:hypothetical protein
MPAEKFGRAVLRPLKSRTLGDFEGVVTLGVAKASKPIFPIRGGRFLRVDGRSESRTVAPLAAQKVGRSLRWPLKSRTLGDFEGVVTLGVAKASKPIFPIRGGRFLRGDARRKIRTSGFAPAQKSDVGGFRGGGNPGRGKSLKTDFPY